MSGFGDKLFLAVRYPLSADRYPLSAVCCPEGGPTTVRRRTGEWLLRYVPADAAEVLADAT